MLKWPIIMATCAVSAAVSALAGSGHADEKTQAAALTAQVEKVLATIVTNPEAGKKASIKLVPSDNPADTVKGKFKSLSIESKPAMVRGRSRFQSFSAAAAEVQVDLAKLANENDLGFTSTKSQTVNFVASSEDFNYLLGRGNDSKKMNLKVKFEENKIHVTGNWKLFVFQGPMDLVGSFKIANQDQVHLVVDTLKINDRNAPPSVIRQFQDKLNPLLDTSDFLFSPKLKTVKIDGQRLVLSSD